MFQKVRHPYKKAFKRHVDRLYTTVQSKRVIIGGETYVLVGQRRLHTLPLFSQFDVYDHVGQSASHVVGEQIYSFVSLFMLVDRMERLRTILQQETSGSNAMMLTEDHSYPSEATDQQKESLDVFLHAVHEVMVKEEWTDTDIAYAQDCWNAFWHGYEHRAESLIDLYETSAGKKEPGVAHAIWEEARWCHQLYTMLTPMNAAPPSYNIQELIAYHYAHGRQRRQDAPVAKNAKMERGLYRFLVIMMRFFTVFILLVLLGMIVDNEFSWGEVLPLLTFPLIASFILAQNRRRLHAKTSTYIAELRAAPSKEVYEQTQLKVDAEHVGTAPERNEQRSLYETVVTSMDIVKVMAIVTMIFFAITIGVMFQEDIEVIALQVMFCVDVIFLMITLWLPFTRMSKRTCVVLEQSIYIGKEKVSPLELIRVVVKNNGSDLDFFVTYTSNPFKIHVRKENREPLRSVLKTWCAQNKVVYQEKNNGS